MQILSLGAAVTQANPSGSGLIFERLGEFLHRDDVYWLRNFFLAMLIAALLLSILWTWIAAKIVVRNGQATIGNACKVVLANLLLPLGVGVGTFFFAPYILENLRGISPVSAWAILGGFILLYVFLWFLIPMRIYEIDLLSAFGFVLLAFAIAAVGNGCGQFVVQSIFHVDRHLEAVKNSMGRTSEERSAFATRLSGKDAPDEIDRLLDDVAQPIGNPKSLAEREAAIQVLQQKLEARRRTLTSGDPKPLAAFQVQFARYMRLLNQAKADRAAQLTPK